MTDREKEVTEIVNRYGKVEYRVYDNPDLPPADSNPIPLAKIPTLATFTEKIGNTEYTVNAHFNEDGRILVLKDVNLMEQSEWPDQFDWITDTMVKMKKAFKKFM